MTLKTLGGLVWEGGTFRQAKLLLLTAYLCLEGPQPRRRVAELFWPRAADPMNSLSVALRKLRAAGLAEADEGRVWAVAACDAAHVRDRLRAGELEAARLYRGAFAEGVTPDEAGEELEDWLYSTRELLAGEVRAALLTLAEREAASGHFTRAGERAESAAHLPGARPPEPGELARLARLLRAAEHPLAEVVEREAGEFGLTVASPEAARGGLRRVLLGRERECETLQALRPGEWGWVRGGPGAGKTSLLRALEGAGWRYLPARGGLPFASLEPLLGEIPGGEDAVLRHLLPVRQDLCLDDWEALDAETRRVLVRLHAARPPVRVVLSGTTLPPFAADQVLDLGPLDPGELSVHPGLFEATGGVPSLVAAWLRGEPPGLALEARLARLPGPDPDLLCALALLEDPDVALVRAALGLPAAELAASLERLLAAGLVEATGRVRGRPAALAHLAAHPAREGRLALALGRRLPGAQALPLYRRARALWEDADLPQVQGAYLAWSAELLRRGFALRAAEALAEAPPAPAVTLLRARALERAGRNLEVLALVGDAADPELRVLKAAVLLRLGRPQEAQLILETVAVDSLEGQAERHTTRGKLATAAGDFTAAEREFRRAANKWLAVGNRERWVVDLTNQAVARSAAGEHEETAFQEALEAAGDSPWNQALVQLNLAYGLSRKHRDADAARVGQQAVDLALEAGALEVAAAALYNLATFEEHLGQPQAARRSYRRCLELAQSLGDYRLVGLSLVGLSVLDRDLDAGRAGIAWLREGGFLMMADHLERALDEFLASSGSPAQP